MPFCLGGKKEKRLGSKRQIMLTPKIIDVMKEPGGKSNKLLSREDREGRTGAPCLPQSLQESLAATRDTRDVAL